MPNYQGGKIYKLWCDCNDMVYVGSTTQSLSKRFYEHKQNCILHPKIKLYDAMIQLGIEHFDIQLIEMFPCNSKEELHSREGFYIKSLNSIANGYNCFLAGRKHRDYYVDNKQRIAVYREANKNYITEYQKKYCEQNKEKILMRSKEYYEQNKNKIIEKHKQYREQHKQKIECQHCNKTLTKISMSRHLKTCKQVPEQPVVEI